MKKVIYLIIFITFFISCEKEQIIQDSISERYQEALDTLINYDNFFIGEFNGELLISNKPHSPGKSIGNTLQDSVSINFDYSYEIANSEKFKALFLQFTVYEAYNKFEQNSFFSYKDYNDFYTFFNRNEFEYFRFDNFKNLTPEIIIYYVDNSQIINNYGVEYKSANFDKLPLNENYFHIDKIKEIENPFKGIELTYSFNCSLFSKSNELLEIKNGKGRCSIRY